MEILCKWNSDNYCSICTKFQPIIGWNGKGGVLPKVICLLPRGVLGYKRDGAGGGGRGATEPNILHPKKYMDLILCTPKKIQDWKF